jgi:LysM domain-containing protein
MIAWAMGAYRPIGLRMLAPVSLVVFGVIFLIVVVSSLGTVQRASQPRRPAPGANQRVYLVKSGDTLVKIATKTGVSIEQLLQLNPAIDPQGLVTGQRVKLRE